MCGRTSTTLAAELNESAIFGPTPQPLGVTSDDVNASFFGRSNKQGNHQEQNYECQKHMPVEDAHMRSIKIYCRPSVVPFQV